MEQKAARSVPEDVNKRCKCLPLCPVAGWPSFKQQNEQLKGRVDIDTQKRRKKNPTAPVEIRGAPPVVFPTLVGGKLFYRCDCVFFNGLQDDCRLPECKNKLECSWEIPKCLPVLLNRGTEPEGVIRQADKEKTKVYKSEKMKMKDEVVDALLDNVLQPRMKNEVRTNEGRETVDQPKVKQNEVFKSNKPRKEKLWIKYGTKKQSKKHKTGPDSCSFCKVKKYCAMHPNSDYYIGSLDNIITLKPPCKYHTRARK